MKKKLLIFHPALAPYRVDQFNSLSKLFELEVVFIFENIDNNKFDQSKLLSLLEFKYSFLLKGICFKGRVFRFGIYKKIKRFNPDIIIGYEYSLITQYLIFLKRIRLIHKRIGSTIDDNIEICTHVQSKGRYFARKISVNKLDILIVMSNEVSIFYQNTFNIKPNQIIVSPILQDPERLRENGTLLEILANQYLKEYKLKGKKILLFVGRFSPEKGLIRFVNHIHSLLLDHKQVVLVLIGNGEDKNAIEDLLKEKSLENKVIVPGRFEGQYLNAWYVCSSGFVIPSTYEPFGAVVNEALIFGLKVFCSKYAGSSYLVTPEKGILYDPFSEKDTVSKLNLFLNEIEIVEKINMMNKPSLMSDPRSDFLLEWNKLISE